MTTMVDEWPLVQVTKVSKFGIWVMTENGNVQQTGRLDLSPANIMEGEDAEL